MNSKRNFLVIGSDASDICIKVSNSLLFYKTGVFGFNLLSLGKVYFLGIEVFGPLGHDIRDDLLKHFNVSEGIKSKASHHLSFLIFSKKLF